MFTPATPNGLMHAIRPMSDYDPRLVPFSVSRLIEPELREKKNIEFILLSRAEGYYTACFLFVKGEHKC